MRYTKSIAIEKARMVSSLLDNKFDFRVTEDGYSKRVCIALEHGAIGDELASGSTWSEVCGKLDSARNALLMQRR